MTKARVHLTISGVVQGVFFRASTRDTALRLGLKGWVRNLPTGEVEAVFEGAEEMLEQAVNWCSKGPPGAHVTEIKEKREVFSGEFKSFTVRHSS